MSTPQTQSAKGPRRSSRRTKNISAGVSDGDQPVSDSGPSPSDTGYVTASSGAQYQVGGRKERSKSQGPKKTHNTPRPDRAADQQRTSPQPNSARPQQRQSTPVKQAYAGPTFHSSPAPSALPLPSFYSKSMPSIPSTQTPGIMEESEAQRVISGPSEAGGDTRVENEKMRESTPLDFLFEAARQARDTPRADSPANRSANFSALEDSPLRRSPAPREGGETVFPFELDGQGSTVNSIGPAFATPYKERMSALLSSSPSQSMNAPDLDDEDRRAKTEALKKLLMTNGPSPQQRQSTTAPYGSDAYNPFHARAPEFRNRNSTRHRSGPSTPIPPFHGSGPYQHFPGLPATAHELRTTGSPMLRPASSHLRHQYQVRDHALPTDLSSDNSTTAPPISTARKAVQYPQSPYQSSSDSSTALPRTAQTPNPKPPHSAQQLEDDLRRVLKLDLTSRG